MFSNFANVWTPLIEAKRVGRTPLRVELAGKHEFTIKAPISQLDRSLRPGDAIRVGLDPAHTRALDVPAAH